MTQPLTKRHPFDAQQEAELARWPGVSWSREPRSKHNALILTFGKVSRFVIYPTTPSDAYRGALNHVRDIRHTLTAMGATRLEVVSSAPRKQHRPQAVQQAPSVHLSAQDGTRLGRDPFAALADFKPRLRGWARIRAYFVRAA